MDPNHSGQDVVRCTLCRLNMGPMYCEICLIHLCKDCIEKHLCDKSKAHKVVSLRQFLSTPKCAIHPTKQCELYCKQCDIPICSQCISSKRHKHHDVVDIAERQQELKDVLHGDLQELEASILPNYQGAVSDISVLKLDFRNNSEKLTKALKRQGKIWHKAIDSIIQEKQSEIDDMKSHLDLLNKYENEINRTVKDITESIQNIKCILEFDDLFEYKSRIKEFRQMPPKLSVTLSEFQPQEINKKRLLKQFGFFTPLSIERNEQVDTVPFQDDDSSTPNRSLLDAPHNITEIVTGYKSLYGVCCLEDEQIWARGDENNIKLYNLQGDVLKTVHTASKNEPYDIAVTHSFNLVYTDDDDRSINILKNAQVKQIIKLRDWRPCGVCRTSSDDLLVTLDSCDKKETKLVRYYGDKEKQCIQWDDQGKPLYTSGGPISENINLDICVADWDAGTVVVVNADGKLRFKYNGPSTTEKPFNPADIANDNQGMILIPDYFNHRVHILDKDGFILRFIDKCSLRYPHGLCCDSRDYLFVAECSTGIVKKIQYYK